MEFFQALWRYIIVAAPFLLGGLLIAGFIHEFISVEKIKKSLGGKSIKNIFKAAAFGIPLPLCSCSVIPSAVTLKKAGASNAATASFVIATPESGVDSIAMTYGMMDLPMTIIRPVAAFFSAIFAGLLQYFFNDDEQVVGQEKAPCCAKSKAKPAVTLGQKFRSIFSYGYGDLLDDMAFWLSVGIVLGAAIDFMVPVNFFDNLHQFGGRMLILLIGIPLYICASATTPIAASLVLKGMSPGMALLILLVGPATNVSNILVLQKYIGKKGIVINVFSIALVAMIFSYITDYLYSLYTWPLAFKVIDSHVHGEMTPLWQQICGGILVALLFKSFYMKKLKKYF